MRNQLTSSRRYNKRNISLIHRRDERKRGSKKKKEKIIIDLSGKTRDPPETWVRKGQTDPLDRGIQVADKLRRERAVSLNDSQTEGLGKVLTTVYNWLILV